MTIGHWQSLPRYVFTLALLVLVWRGVWWAVPLAVTLLVLWVEASTYLRARQARR